MARLLIPLFLTASAAAQCCLGAQNATVDCASGRYRVEARSQTGTGPDSHGPYRFVFTTLRMKADGLTEKLGEFERQWDTKQHFSMQIRVSETGNGFLLGSSLEKGLRFFAPDGRVLREVGCDGPQSICPYDKPGPQLVRLNSSGRANDSRRSLLWLPLCQVVGPEDVQVEQADGWGYQPIEGTPRWPQLGDGEIRWLARMFNWSEERGERERESVEASLVRLDDGDRAAAEELVELGLSARPLLETAKHKELLDQIDVRLCGHSKPWQNRALLTALLGHPSKTLRDAAGKQLTLLDRK